MSRTKSTKLIFLNTNPVHLNFEMRNLYLASEILINVRHGIGENKYFSTFNNTTLGRKFNAMTTAI